MDLQTALRHRPFGVIVVALLQLGTILLALAIYVSGITMPWQGPLAELLRDGGGARLAIVAFAILVAVATIGMWFLRRWGWALMIALVAISLLMDIGTWMSQGDQDRSLALYARMALDVITVFYLNSSGVQEAFRQRSANGRQAVASTDATASAGRMDP